MIKTRKTPTYLMNYIRGHQRAVREGWLMPWKRPLKSLLTILTLAICFYIPLLLWTMWLNYDELQSNWQDQSSVAIFLHAKLDLKEAGIFLQEIKENPHVKSASLINSQEIKQQLNNDEQLSKVIALISSQDLPKQISIKINHEVSLEKIEKFISNLSINPQVEYVSYDKQWLTQLEVLTNTLLQMARISALMFLMIIMVILANTITNEITDHKTELKLLELIGATWPQVRRSFLYMGVFFGVIAGALSVLFLSFSLWWLQDTLTILFNNFGIEIQLHNLKIYQVLMVIMLAMIVTWIAARVTLSAQRLDQLD